MTDYEAAKIALLGLVTWQAETGDQDRNEASTRFHIIDRMLRDALGWRPEEIAVEERACGGISDYELGLEAKLLVIEAKREGIAFQLPAGFDKKEMKLSSLADLEPAIASAIDQAMGYALERGIPMAAVTNGNQWIGFVASRTDGVPPKSGRAVIFASIADIVVRFRDFWEAFSRPGVHQRRLNVILRGPALTAPAEKLSEILTNYPGYKNRNPVAADLQILGGLFLEDIMRQPAVELDFLKDCYYASGTLSRYSLLSKEILQARYSLFFEQEAEVSAAPVETKKGLSQDLVADAAAASLGQRPIILLGDVGVGKTMFVRHFIQIDAAEALKQSIVLYVDFGSQPALADDLKRYVQAEFVRQLREDFGWDIYADAFVRNTYQGEVERFRRSVAGGLHATDPAAFKQKEIEHLEGLTRDLDSHLRASLQSILSGSRRQTVIFLDNVDQRQAAFQEEVFLIAQTLASSWPCTCFVALRPETFQRSRREGFLTAYQPRVFTIQPPRADRVIQRRIAFARTQLQTTGQLSSFPSHVSLGPSRLDKYFGVLEDALDHQDPLMEFLDNMSGGNIRRALDFVEMFIGSGHVDAGRIFAILDGGGRYVLPLHEFLRAVIFGEHVYYNPADSPVGNLFDITSPDGREHFLLPLLLGFAERAAKGSGEQGFVEAREFYAFSQGIGFEPRQVEFALDRGRSKQMLDAFPRHLLDEWGTEPEPPSHLRITSVGSYHLRRLTSMFTYVDSMVTDTPIVDSAVRSQIHDVDTIDDRLERARRFSYYLDDQWQNVASVGLPFDWAERSHSLIEDIGKVTAGAARNRS